MRCTRACLLLFITLFSSGLYAQTLTLDQNRSQITFKVKSMIMNRVKGSFKKFSGTIDYEPKTHAIKSLTVIIDASTISTNNSMRDTHLRGADFFNTEFFPQILFHYEEVLNRYLTGEVMIKDKSYYITFKIDKHLYKDKQLILHLHQTIKRDNYGINHGWNMMIAQDVQLDIVAYWHL